MGKSWTKEAKRPFPAARGDSHSTAHGPAVHGRKGPRRPEPRPEAAHFPGDAAASASFRPGSSPYASLQQGRCGFPAGSATTTEAGQWGVCQEVAGEDPLAPRCEAGQKWPRGDGEARGRGRQTVPPRPQERWCRAWCHLGGSCGEPE